ncbi:MAG: pantoate--beta-alanine ligase [Planctomycetes bacterium]|nr:pantoate--beta-alanine ligase [Planctomycetota bacterium]
MVEVIKTTGDMKARAALSRARGDTLGFVPTMGALHEGHLSLIRRARAENDSVIISIFVNPVQFDRNNDYQGYPRPLERDLAMASEEGVDVAFVPDVEQIYPEGYSTFIEVRGSLTDGLCGDSRPGHFRGVTTVVTKLFNIVGPDRAYFGQKDFQQAAIIKRLVRDLNMGVEVVALPTVREADGLALSSRNRHLSGEQRQTAVSIHRALARATELFISGERDTAVIVCEVRGVLNEGGIARIDYVSIVDPETLEEVSEARPGAVVTVAAWVGDIRLIDNTALGVGPESQLFMHLNVEAV